MKIAFLGDVALFGRNTVRDTSYIERFKPICEILQSCDYVVANLETPLTDCCHHVRGKSAYIKGCPEDVEILKYLGITHVSLANNHMFDYGPAGLEETVRVLNNNEIKWYGANGQVSFLKDDNSKVCLQGYCCYSTNGKGLRDKAPYINKLDPFAIEKNICDLKKDNVLPVLSLHWGEEHIHYPNYDHIQVARKLCQGHEVIIHGHHPHVIQGVETVGKSLIAYSLGNFCFDDVYTPKSKEPLVALSKDNRESFIMIVDVNESNITDYQLIPFTFSNSAYSLCESDSVEIREWSEFLNKEKAEYNRIREATIKAYLDSRKKKRDFSWYLKRMNMESVYMILSSYLDRRKYQRLILRYIYEDSAK